MTELGNKMARKRKDLGMTQTEFAEKLNVTRQTVGRWETGSALPDIDKIGDIAALLGVSCPAVSRGVSRLLLGFRGKRAKLNFYDGEADIDLYDAVCRIADFEGNWMKVEAETKKGKIEKLIPVSSVLSLELVEEVE